MRILVLRGGALGDFIVTLPALRLLRARWPQARIELAGNATAGALGVLDGVVDTVHSQHEARWAQLYAAGTPLAPDFRAWLEAFDLIVSFWPDPEGDLRRRFAHRGTAFLSGGARATTAPAAAHFCAELGPLRLSPQGEGEFISRITLPADVHAEAGRRLRADAKLMIAIHPGSGSPHKNWPVERWRALVQRVHAPVLVVTGPAEEAVDFASFSGAGGSPVQVAANWSLPVLAAALARVRVFVGHDTGVAHLAAAMGTRCVLLFGPTDPAVWAPPGDHVCVLRSGSEVAAITVDEVQAALNG